jgi:hypothetical protein
MIRLNDLRVTDSKHRQSLLKAFENILIHVQVLLGPECEQIESISATLNQKTALPLAQDLPTPRGDNKYGRRTSPKFATLQSLIFEFLGSAGR